MIKRKNFLPTLLVTLFSWVSLTLLIFNVSPNSYLIITTFYLLLFITLFLTFSFVFTNRRQGFLMTLGLVVFLLLRQFKIAHFVNLILLFFLWLSLELYFRKR